MSDKSTSSPYEPLGSRLRELREQHSESLAEVSGAVEIDEADLTHIESGKDRPSEDILLLLINHFNLAEERAEELWQLAGYDHGHAKHDLGDSEDIKHKSGAMMIMLDPRVMYSDSIEVVSNKQGVVLNFSQTASPENPALTVSRIGMSYDQAKAVMGILHQVLYNHENPGNGRRLHGGNTKKD